MAAPPGIGVLGAGPPPGTAAAVWVSKAERTASIVAAAPVRGLVVPLAAVPVVADEAERVQAPINSAVAISAAVASPRIGMVAMGTSKDFVREPALSPSARSGQAASKGPPVAPRRPRGRLRRRAQAAHPSTGVWARQAGVIRTCSDGASPVPWQGREAPPETETAARDSGPPLPALGATILGRL